MAEDKDIVDVLLEDHEEFRTLFEEVRGADEEDRDDLFRYLVGRLASHEAAEEALVHKALRDEVEGGREVAEAVLEEEASAEERLARMAKKDEWDQEFVQDLNGLEQQVLAHADHEEKEEFPLLRQHLSRERRVELAERFVLVRDTGPTRPHPGTPQTPEVRAAAGPIAGMFDRARDTARSILPGG
jgi:hemerythrin superfamily protein